MGCISSGLTPTGVRPLITTDTYLGYAMAMLLIFGLAFELPLVMVILNLAGVLTHARMRKWRRVMIFAVFAFAAVATPSPDPFSMLLLAVPLRDPGRAGRGLRVGQRPPPRPPVPSMYAGLADDEISPLDFDDSVSSTTDSR